ncbi:hypothetical protein I0C86_41490 [Plantactinospora sp. S1510]|uniref:Uncharacterized protein n=1 Tax=Plantactinospora alkalitolerans TaxID=2789879 RepID=A0ABS0HB34_9ACTN|nr:hypothetical protein [Plantactinospora alkalitolerans]MBF9135327.1 hypothetical protein [Plantactinospora alkalitolerans]
MARFTASRLERESKLRDKRQRDPFEYESESPGYEGQSVTFQDPNRLHYLQLRKLGKGDIDETIRLLLTPEDYERFVSFPEVNGELMQDLFSAYGDHYSMEPGE